jgi:SAM-dependent methyltransferase
MKKRMGQDYSNILSAPIEESVKARGITPQAVWLDKERALEKGVSRCDAIFRMIGARRGFTILDLGCGPGFAVGFLEERYGSLADRYCGVDVSELLVEEAQRIWPPYQFMVRDIVADPMPERSFDFTAINGVLTAKFGLTQDQMERFATSLLEAAWQSTRIAMSFNVMSPFVDWTREDLFHWPIERAAEFCVSKLSRHFNIITDYGLYEYTVQVFREPLTPSGIPKAWAEASTHSPKGGRTDGLAT